MADKPGAAAATADGEDAPGDGKGIASWGAWFGHLTTMLEKLIKLAASALIILLFLFALLLVLDGVTSRSLVVEEFRTAKQFEAQGIDGSVLARKLLDRINALQRTTNTTRPAVSYSNHWDEDIKLVIPQTGTSVGEIRRLIREWLGRETRIGGELLGSADSVELTVRMGGSAAVVEKGKGIELDAVIDRAALAIFRETQPYRHATHLRSEARRTYDATRAERMSAALKAARDLATKGPAEERPWGMLAWGNMLQAMDAAPADVIERIEAAASQLGDQPAPWANIGEQYLILSEPEQALRNFRKATLLLARGGEVSDQFRDSLVVAYPASVDELRGDYREAVRGYEKAARHAPVDYWTTYVDKAFHARLASHDVTGARRLLRLYGGQDGTERLAAAGETLRRLHPDAGKDAPILPLIRARGDATADIGIYRAVRNLVAARYDQLREAAAAGDWATVRSGLDPAVAESKAALTVIQAPLTPTRIASVYWPAYAGMYVTLGDTGKARELVALATARAEAANGYDLKLALGRLAAREGDWRAADRHFAAAVRQAPSIPFAWLAWGDSFARRGDARRALDLYDAAHRKGRGWADPLKRRGDLMMRQGRFGQAIIDYRRAADRAPRWAALHRNLGIAYWQNAQQDRAREVLRSAARMDLGPADRALLEKFWARHVGGPI